MSSKIINPHKQRTSVGTKMAELEGKSDLILQGMTIMTNRMLVIMRIIQDNMQLSNEDFDKLYDETEAKLIEEAKERMQQNEVSNDEKLPESTL